MDTLENEKNSEISAEIAGASIEASVDAKSEVPVATNIVNSPTITNHQSIYIYARRIIIVLSVTLLVVLIILALYLNGKSIYEQGL